MKGIFNIGVFLYYNKDIVIDLIAPAWPFISKLLILVGAVVLAVLVWKIRLHYLNAKYIAGIEWVTLEVRIPKEVYKSPQAMELVLNTFYQTSPGDWYKKYVKGITRFWFSLEIISIEGKIYFLLHIPKFFKNLVESQIYAQYPQAEINEVSDYSRMIPPYMKGGKWDMFGVEFKLTKEDPYPIKTYVDYGMDRAVGSLEEMEKIDPLTPMLEFLGMLGPGEQAWVQILIRAPIKDWKKEGEELIQKLKEPFVPKEGKATPDMTKDVQDVINAVNRSISKLGFETGIRAIYLAQKDNFNASNIPGLIGSIRQYGSQTLNGIKPSKVTAFTFPWQDPTGRRTAKLKEEMLDAYRRRSFFHPPYKRKPFILNTEELATIYHFPGQVVETPSFKRIESKKAEPPADLPI